LLKLSVKHYPSSQAGHPHRFSQHPRRREHTGVSGL
jgi:hypothetical protein